MEPKESALFTRLAALVITAVLAPACASPAAIANARGVGSSAVGFEQHYGFQLAPTPFEGRVGRHTAWGVPFWILGHGTRVLPYARVTDRWVFGDHDHFAEGGREAQRFRRVDEGPHRTVSERLRWHNAVFQDTATGEQWTLLEERGVVSRFWARVELEEQAEVTTALLFAVTVEDGNGDGILDDEDPIRALMTDPDGRSPRFVTPPGTKLSSVDFHGDDVLLSITMDADGDGEFEDSEWAEPYILRPGETTAQPLVDPTLRARIDDLLGG